MQLSIPSSHRIFLRNYLILSTFILLAVAIFNYVVDPLQFYRRAWYPVVYSKNQRYQNPGLAKNYTYDTVIIGTSHTENFLPSSVNRKLGINTLKLSIKGSTAKEQSIMVGKALATAKVKNVIWGIELSSFAGEADRINEQDGSFPEYLYDETPLTHLMYLLSWDTTTLSTKALQGEGDHDLETLNTWYDQYTFSTDRVQAAWEVSAVKSQEMRVQTSNIVSAQTMRTIQVHLVDVITKHPEVKFYLFFPPYSILAYIPYGECDYDSAYTAFSNHLRFKEAVVRLILPFRNVELYDFQPIVSITHNLNNYKDLTHYSLQVTEYMIDSIANGQHRVTKSNSQELISTLDKQVQIALQQNTSAGSMFYHCPSQGQATSDLGMQR